MEANPFPTHTDTGIYKNIAVIKLDFFYPLFPLNHENKQRNRYKMIWWKDLSLPTDHWMKWKKWKTDFLDEKQDQAIYLYQLISTEERITQIKSWQQLLQAVNPHDNLEPNKQKAHGN